MSAFLILLALLASLVFPSAHPAPATSAQDAAILVTLGDYAPADGRGVLTDAQWSALLPVYRASETTGADCAGVARTLMITGAFTGAMVPCLGEEDSPAVDTLLALGHH